MARGAGPPLRLLLLLLLQLLALPAGRGNRTGPDTQFICSWDFLVSSGGGCRGLPAPWSSSRVPSEAKPASGGLDGCRHEKLFTPCTSPSTSLRAHRSCPSTAGMGTPSSSTSMFQKTPCCFAGSCKHPGGKDLSAPAWRSQCMHFRYGAPPVINPLVTRFPANATVRPSYNISITLNSAVQNTTFVNITTPAAGDWFIAAHLPEAAGRIEVKGFSTPCPYMFQADMFVLRLSDMPVLEPGVAMPQTIVSPAKPLHVKVFVPKHAAGMRFELRSCVTSEQKACVVRVVLGSIMLPQSFQRIITCTGSVNCSLALDSPPWEKWLQIMVESLSATNANVSVEMVASFTACRPGSTSSFLNFSSLNQSQAGPRPGSAGAAGSSSLPTGEASRNVSEQRSFCLQNQPVVREDLDVTSTSLGNATVVACVSAASPVLSLTATQNCSTAFFQGYPLSVSTSSAEAMLIVLYPQTDDWFLSLQLICPKGQGECNTAEAKVTVFAYLTPCFNDCGPYGQCSLLRRHGYLYAGCSCKAGWGGWSCTDDTKAQSVGVQNLATLLLTLSNLMFLPAIAVAVYRYYLVEASVYTYTMFFSTFYHACDQPGVAVMCIMDYDTLQYCDFLGSVVSIWVTILCMSRVKKILKYVLFILGTLLIAMSLQLDRRGVWNMMGPCLFALVIMIAAWVYHGVKRKHCYPSSWKRWVFYLLPGITLAFIAISVYAFMETNENYYYTHSIWHVLVACSVAFLLPPRDKHKKPWAWSQKLTCRYQICQNDREELYAVT
ncbi:post-GPI attachment to proteins factor 6 isoform X2 [Tyto alba]|uniref:post-GPI attachment to proteins factor 6 isoform X2 n=1 Tax=Tyto alba TaxID=56313 RepID=UPI001C677096|nr:post-GPI attachment to proteins factor 6 isoform X2 [Tyto alba]